MTLSPVIDGGDILAHYFPAISKDDTPATLFMKTAMGAATLYQRVLSDMERGTRIVGCPQGKPMFYFRGSDWTLHQSCTVRRLIDGNVAERFSREEQVSEYWSLSSPEAAREAMRKRLMELLNL
ncbi:MAG: hypothetical protein FJ405_04700 [Verrucomicrobia bacterium]|nr:hypothetical protein [Verrucomicrobiota bacterium]